MQGTNSSASTSTWSALFKGEATKPFRQLADPLNHTQHFSFTVESVVELGPTTACRRSTASDRAHRRKLTQILWSTYFVARI